MKIFKMTAKLTKATRRNCSIYGNPAWSLILEYDGETIEAKTASDAQCGYSVSNYKIGDFINIRGHYTRAGNFVVDFID